MVSWAGLLAPPRLAGNTVGAADGAGVAVARAALVKVLEVRVAGAVGGRWEVVVVLRGAGILVSAVAAVERDFGVVCVAAAAC